MARDDGGSAFPRNGHPDKNDLPHDGMTLRDYFAIHALAGMLAYPGDNQRGSFHNNCTRAGAAEIAYEYAAEMLAARSHVPPPSTLAESET